MLVICNKNFVIFFSQIYFFAKPRLKNFLLCLLVTKSYHFKTAKKMSRVAKLTCCCQQ